MTIENCNQFARILSNSQSMQVTLQTVYDICRLQTADCRLQTADCRLQTADRRLQTADYRLHEAARHYLVPRSKA